MIDFTIPADPLPLDQLLVDCKDTLKYQVKTGRHSTLPWEEQSKVESWEQVLGVNSLEKVKTVEKSEDNSVKNSGECEDRRQDSGLIIDDR